MGGRRSALTGRRSPQPVARSLTQLGCTRRYHTAAVLASVTPRTVPDGDVTVGTKRSSNRFSPRRIAVRGNVTRYDPTRPGVTCSEIGNSATPLIESASDGTCSDGSGVAGTGKGSARSVNA